MRKSLPVKDKQYLDNVQEAFVCVPLESGKSLVYFFSEFNYGNQGPTAIVNSSFQDNVRVLRVNVLAAIV